MDHFDPYHKWLGIAAHEQPPTHYRLLGIAPFECDPDGATRFGRRSTNGPPAHVSD